MISWPRIAPRLVPCAHSFRPLGVLCSILLSSAVLPPALAQSIPVAPSSQAEDPHQIGEIERRLSDLTDTLTRTQAALQQSQAELARLRAEVAALRLQESQQDPKPAPTELPATSASTDSSVQAQLEALKEQEDLLQAEVKQHEQTKVESASKYNISVTGLALFNAYSNAGVVDSAELPSFALPRNPGSSHGSAGATLRQTIVGIAASGPVVAGAQSSVSINVDFFGGATANSFGYSSPGGFVRLRDGQLGLAWNTSRLQFGYTVPLISPLSPTSFATVAQPALSASGNLWTWSPQLQFQQDLRVRDKHSISLEAGLIYPQSPTYSSSSIQLDSAVQASRRPGVEGRIAYRAEDSAVSSPHSLVLGVGAYTASQFYDSKTHIHSWAVTGDWQLPLSKRIDLRGEVYRGRALGGLGGGLYKDIYTGTDPISGQSRTVGVETAGGWTQLKFLFSHQFEANTMFGLDDAFSGSLHSVLLPAYPSALTLTARNSTVTANLVYRPRSSLIFSPEYRRVQTWQYTGAPYVANIFTLSAGYKF